ncbi:TIGR04388 family protein, partial [Leptospira noguchii]|uniref:TIGR04388 family protein n=1 Tax=Leptospira noguchii TaxID=28182 RepID=UPI000328608E
KEALSQTPDGLKKWKEELSRAGERSGIEVKFNDGKSATSTFGKFVTGLMGDVAQSFGFANDGSKMVDKAGVFHLDTCMRGDVPVFRLKNKNIRIYGNINSTEVNLNEINSNDYEFTNIEEIKIGDVVKSWNENTNLFENKRVTQTFVHEVPQLFFLELDGEEEIHTTWNHPFRRRTPSESGEVSTANAVSSSELLGVSAYELLGVSLLDVSVSNGGSSETNNNLLVLGENDQENSVLQLLTTNQLATNISKAQTLTSSLTTRSEWVKVEDLRLRDQVLRSDGSWGTVTGIYYYNTEPTKVYNLEVEDNHTYVVGGDTLGIGYVVHNYDQTMRDVLAKVNTPVKDRIAMAQSRDKFDFEGSTWVKKGGEEILDKNGKVKGHKPTYYESESNQYHKNDRLYIEPTADGKDIQLRQVQKEGDHYRDVKLYDKYFNWKGNVDTIGNLPHLNPSDPNSVKFHLDYTEKFAQERGYTFEKDANGKTKTHTMNVDGESRAYTKSDDGKTMLLLGYTAVTQRDTYYKDLEANGKKIIYDRLLTNDDLTADGICNARAPGTVMSGLGLKMTDAQVKEYGSMGVMVARASQEHGNTMIDGDNPFGRKPSNIPVEVLSANSFSKFGFEVPPKGIIYNDVRKPELPKRDKFDSDMKFEKAMDLRNEQLEARAQSSVDKVKPWIIEQIKHGNPVVVGGDFTGSGHVVTIVGFTPTGYIVHDSYGDRTKGYDASKTSGQFVHYKYGSFSLGYGYILKRKK